MARRLGVSRDDVIAAAVLVADRDGLEKLTVAAVAGEVGCRPPSVYHHVDGLDGLCRAVAMVAAEELYGIITAAGEGKRGVDALFAMAIAAHDWGTDHPARYDALRRPVDADAYPDLAAARSRLKEPARELLATLDLPLDEQASVLEAIGVALRGCISAENDSARSDGDAGAAARAAGCKMILQLLFDHLRTKDHSVSTEPAGATT